METSRSDIQSALPRSREPLTASHRTTSSRWHQSRRRSSSRRCAASSAGSWSNQPLTSSTRPLCPERSGTAQVQPGSPLRTRTTEEGRTPGGQDASKHWLGQGTMFGVVRVWPPAANRTCPQSRPLRHEGRSAACLPRRSTVSHVTVQHVKGASWLCRPPRSTGR